MSSVGSGYDLSASTYSPDGRLYQIEYANKAVENAGTVVGLRVKDGIVLAVEKLVTSKLLVPGANKRIASVDYHAGLATTGLLADGRHLANRAQEEAESYRDNYRSPISIATLAERLGLYSQAYTLYSSVRPFGIAAVLAGVDKAKGPQLFCIEPNGVYWGYRGCAIGKGKQLAKTEIEKLKLDSMTCREAVHEAARIIYQVHDEVKDKDFELEMTWCSLEETKGKHVHVPQELLEAAEAAAKAKLDEEMEED